MNAEYFAQAGHVDVAPPGSKAARLRKAHRWISMAFTLTVAGNFVVMAWGPPPAWITYAPLPPLFLLMLTGIAMFVLPFIRGARRPGPHA